MQPITLTGLKRLQGPWFEIARLDNATERDRKPVLLVYYEKQNHLKLLLSQSNESEGSGQWVREAHWMGAPDTASFTIPCLGYLLCGYHIIAEDTEKHQWLMVTGHSRKYLWVLARAPGLEDAKFAAIKKQARDWGYDADGMVIHNDPVPLPKILPPVPQMRPNVRRGAEVPVMPGTEPPSRMEPKSPELLPMDEPPSMPPEGPPPMPAEGPPPMPPNPPPMPPNPPPMPSFVPEPMGPIYLQPNSEGSENPEP